MTRQHQTTSARRPVLIMAGGTGGHIFPGLAVAHALHAEQVPVLWLGAKGGMEERLVAKAGIPLHTLRIGGLRGKGLLTQLMVPLRLLWALGGALRLLLRTRPRCVLSMGGYVAGPGGIAAWLLRKPLLVHEQNRVPGMTNRYLAKVASKVMVGFADAFPRATPTIWAGNPVRADIAQLPPPQERMAARTTAIRLLVVGGSLGAHALNEGVPRILAANTDLPPLSVWHQCGERDQELTRAQYETAQIEARVDSFIDDMAQAYAWADLVICRAGALTVAELCAAGVASILVPFPYAVDDHQTKNAQALVAVGGAVLIQQADIAQGKLAQALFNVTTRRETLLRMAENARRLARPEAARDIARLCMEVA